MSEEAELPPDPLSLLSYRERAFVYAYVGEARHKATIAAKIAGYTGDRYTLKVTGCRVQNRPHVKAAITALLESESCSVAEAWARISDRARTSMADVFTVGPDGFPRFDLAHAFETGGIHSIRKLKISFTIRNGRIVSQSVTVELYDAIKCDALILRAAGLPRKRVLQATDAEIISCA